MQRKPAVTSPSRCALGSPTSASADRSALHAAGPTQRPGSCCSLGLRAVPAVLAGSYTPAPAGRGQGTVEGLNSVLQSLLLSPAVLGQCQAPGCPRPRGGWRGPAVPVGPRLAPTPRGLWTCLSRQCCVSCPAGQPGRTVSCQASPTTMPAPHQPARPGGHAACHSPSLARPTAQAAALS